VSGAFVARAARKIIILFRFKTTWRVPTLPLELVGSLLRRLVTAPTLAHQNDWSNLASVLVLLKWTGLLRK
jgi:hypothetical protein